MTKFCADGVSKKESIMQLNAANSLYDF